METGSKPAHDLMNDVTAVDWLPLDAALARLSRGHERAFLATVGPLALAAAVPAKSARRPKAKPPVRRKQQDRPAATILPSLPVPVPDPPQPDQISSISLQDQSLQATIDPLEAEPSVCVTEFEIVTPFAEADLEAAAVEPESGEEDPEWPVRDRNRSLVQKVRGWLQRSA
jgi:8-oxo-dGTP diphosphatase